MYEIKRQADYDTGDFRKKRGVAYFTVLAEVFNSKLLQSVGIPTVENFLLQTNRVMPFSKKPATCSKKIKADKGEYIYGLNGTMDGAFLMQRDNYFNERLPAFQDIKLRKVMPNFASMNDDIKREFVNIWLTSNLTANTDMFFGHNIDAVCDKKDRLCGFFPNYDFEFCRPFLPEKEVIVKEFWSNLNERFFAERFSLGYRRENLDFVKENYPDVLHNFNAKLSHLRAEDTVAKLSNFCGLQGFIDSEHKFFHYDNTYFKLPTQRLLTDLSHRVCDGYRKRIDMLLDEKELG
jgi:hypothetical protein